MKHYQIIDGALTATGDSVAVDVSECIYVAAYINVTAVSGTTPSLTPKLQTSVDGTNWFDLTSGSAITAAGKATVVAAIPTYLIGTKVRLDYAITGTTPSFTCTVDIIGK